MSAEPLDWVDTTDLLQSTGARNLTRSGDEHTFSCMGGSHAHGDSSPSAGMNARTSLWRCRSAACGLKGNAVDYLIALKQYTRSEATRILSERYGGPENSVEQGQLLAELERIRAARDEPEEQRRYPTEDEYLDRFSLHWPAGAEPDDFPAPMAYMLRRGFTAETLNRWAIGYDQISDRITIPVYDSEGALVGIKGRAWDDRQPRYLSIGDANGRPPRYGFDTYHKSQHVFGLDVANWAVVLVEGELNVIALWQMGIPAVGVAGSDFSERQALLIASAFDEVTVFFDGDAAGDKGTERVMQMLTPYMSLSIVFGSFYDAADAIDPEKDFSEVDLRATLQSAQPWLSSRVS